MESSAHGTATECRVGRTPFAFLSFAFAVFAARAAADPFCLRALGSTTRFPQEASLHVLRAAIERPDDPTPALVYADTLDQDFSPTPRQQAEAAAIRLAIAIQNEGGDDNPFAVSVKDGEEQRRRLQSHPMGPVLLRLWTQAGWHNGNNDETHFLVRNGLPRSIGNWDQTIYPPQERARRSLDGVVARMPSVTSVRYPFENEREGHRWRDVTRMAMQGHLGLSHGLAQEMRKARFAERGPGYMILGDPWRDLILWGARRWIETGRPPGAEIPTVIREAWEAAVARRSSKPENEARRAALERWLRWLDGELPLASDFFVDRPRNPEGPRPVSPAGFAWVVLDGYTERGGEFRHAVVYPMFDRHLRSRTPREVRDSIQAFQRDPRSGEDLLAWLEANSTVAEAREAARAFRVGAP